jgi:transcription elongation factor GreB
MKADLITREGWNALDAELRELWKVERPAVTRAVGEAAAMGDRSENADYIYGKKRLREIDRRVRYLRKQIEALKIVDYHPDQEGKIYFGAQVTIMDEDGREARYRIVGSDEIEATVREDGSRTVSIDSPLARAMVGKTIDDEIAVRTPAGMRHYTVEAVRYSADPKKTPGGPGIQMG